MNKKYIVRLTLEERSTLGELVVTQRRVAASKRKRAQVLLKVDEGEHGRGWTDEAAAEAFDASLRTVARVRQQLVEDGLEGALQRKKQVRLSRARKLNNAGEAQLLAVAQSNPPAGRARWTLQLLGDRLVTLQVVDSISLETVRKALKKTTSSRTFRSGG